MLLRLSGVFGVSVTDAMISCDFAGKYEVLTYRPHAASMNFAQYQPHLDNVRLSQERAARGGQMDGTEYRAALKATRLSQVRAARWLGISVRTSRAYALGERPILHVVALCIRKHLKHGWYACQWEFSRSFGRYRSGRCELTFGDRLAPPQWLPRSVTRHSHRNAALRPGSRWCRSSTAPVVKTGSAASPSRAIDICGGCLRAEH